MRPRANHDDDTALTRLSHAHLPLVAIIGRANVGKSTLFNRLTHSSRAVVADEPGVTRDRHYGVVMHEGRAFALVDTGGLVGGDEAWGEMVRRQAEAAVAEADAILLLMDGREGPQPGDADVAAYLRRTGKPLILAVNKIDHQTQEKNLPEFYSFGIDPFYPVSAAHGLGLYDLLDALTMLLPPPQEVADTAPGLRVAVVGRPNVGKSSFINRFLGEERLLVSPTPGTTRDAIDTPWRYGDTDYLLVDTAGLRRPSHIEGAVEQQMVLKTIRALSRAEVAVLLLYAQEGLTGQDLRIAGLIEDQGKGCLVLLNKWDLVRNDTQGAAKLLAEVKHGLEFMAYAPVLAVSVKTGHNLRRVFPLVNEIYAQSGKRHATRELNLLLAQMVGRTPPPRHRHRPVKFLYLTQPEVHPPTFIAFVNHPQGVPDHYRRYLVKQLRAALNIPYAPVRLFLKGRRR